MAAPFEYRQAREVAAAMQRRRVRYLFLGKGGAVLLGFPDTTQDADIFLERSPTNRRAAVDSLRELGFDPAAEEEAEILQGKDFIQLRNGPFDLGLVYAPDGIGTFADADSRAVEVEGLRVCHIDDIIASKEAAGPVKDRETLPRLKAFRDWLERERRG